MRTTARRGSLAAAVAEGVTPGPPREETIGAIVERLLRGDARSGKVGMMILELLDAHARPTGTATGRKYLARMWAAHMTMDLASKAHRRAVLWTALDKANATTWLDHQGKRHPAAWATDRTTSAARTTRLDVARSEIERFLPFVSVGDTDLALAVEAWPSSRKDKWIHVRAVAKTLGCDAKNLRIMFEKDKAAAASRR